jgi:hypothetical protein
MVLGALVGGVLINAHPGRDSAPVTVPEEGGDAAALATTGANRG